MPQLARTLRCFTVLATLLGTALFLAKASTGVLAASLFPMDEAWSAPERQGAQGAAQALATAVLDSGLFARPSAATESLPTENQLACGDLRLLGTVLDAAAGPSAVVVVLGTHMHLRAGEPTEEMTLEHVSYHHARVRLTKGPTCELKMFERSA